MEDQATPGTVAEDSLVHHILDQVDTIVREAESETKPLEIDPYRGRMFELFVTAEGAGLGAQFLRHLSRNLILLHLIDVQPEDGSDPLDNALAIEAELGQYSSALLERPIWLVLSKVDQLDETALDTLIERFHARLPDRGVRRDLLDRRLGTRPTA